MVFNRPIYEWNNESPVKRMTNGLFVTMMMTAWIEMEMAGYDVFSMAVIALTLFLKMKSFVLWRLLFRAHCSTSLVPGH